MKRKQSNHRRYMELCDEELKQTKRFNDPLYEEIQSRRYITRSGEYVSARLMYWEADHRFMLEVKFRDYCFHKTSRVEGNFDRAMATLDMIQVIVNKGIAHVKRMEEEADECN